MRPQALASQEGPGRGGNGQDHPKHHVQDRVETHRVEIGTSQRRRGLASPADIIHVVTTKKTKADS